MVDVGSKRLVVCFDGTWNAADSADAATNVARMAQAVRATSGDKLQVTLYLRGVGSTGLAVQRVVEGAVGEGIDENIRSAYMFLAQNYVPDDEIFLFGFSRGAFQARSLVGFIGACGLLKRQHLDHVLEAWTYYRTVADHTPAGFCTSCGAECHIDPPIAFLGVWDTVGALGIPGSLFSGLNTKYQFLDTTPSRLVRRGRHALAVDEQRHPFVPTFWTGIAPEGSDLSQVWFAGVHSDCGGGYPERALADIPLAWMAEEAEQAGLQLDWDVLLPNGKAALDPLAPQHESRQGWAAVDLLRPMIREVCGQEIPVGPMESLYRPLADDGSAKPTIAESLHPSLAQRFGQTVKVITGDSEAEITYLPRNLAPLLGAPAKGQAS